MSGSKFPNLNGIAAHGMKRCNMEKDKVGSYDHCAIRHRSGSQLVTFADWLHNSAPSVQCCTSR